LSGDPMSDSIEPLLQFFAYEHLKPELQEISKPFGDLAQHIVRTSPVSGIRRRLENW
jgi:hypothetical protein